METYGYKDTETLKAQRGGAADVHLSIISDRKVHDNNWSSNHTAVICQACDVISLEFIYRV